MQRALLGIDVGTTNTKVVAFSTDGVELAKASVPTETLHPQQGWTEYDVDGLWNAVCDLLKQALRQLPDGVTPVAISATGMAEAGVPLDGSGNPLYSAISWLDRRTTDELEIWQETVGADRTANTTGLPMNTTAGILRLLWLRNNVPETFGRTERWLNLPDYCAYKLSSAAITDYSLASRMMILDLKKKQWSADLLDEIGIGQEIFGKLVQSGTKIGAVTEEAAASTGLPTGIPVCAGGHDHLCAALGLGVTQTGDVFDSMGTAEAIVVSLKAPSPTSEIAGKGIAQGVHVVPGQYYAISGLFYSGGSIDWVRQLLTSAIDNELSSAQAYERIQQLASEVKAGSDGVHFLPHLQQANPPIFDPHSRGAFVGLSGGTGAGHLARSVMEGLAYEFQRLFDCVVEAFGVDGRSWIASGGGTRNQLLMEIKAAVAGKPINIPVVDEATCLGAAVLAGIGAGVYSSVEDAQAKVQFTSRTIECDADLQHVYAGNYKAVFLHLYDSLQELNHKINKLAENEA